MNCSALVLPLLVACAAPHTRRTPEDPDDTTPTTAPEPPADLQRWLTGSPADASPTPSGPLLVVAGGGGDVDAAMRRLLLAAEGGDVVVLRTSGEDGYNDYLYADLGVAVDSVETLRVDTPALADDPYVAWRLQTAEAVFLAGGDQWTYLQTWTGTATQAALQDLWTRGAALGGTSAGAAILGKRAFSAAEGSVYSEEALLDPYNKYMTFQNGFLSLPPLAGVITDTHFYARDRMGRLLAFTARALVDAPAERFVGIGVDEDTALVIDAQGRAEVLGDGYAYVVQGEASTTRCQPGTPLDIDTWTYQVVHPGDALQLPEGLSDGPTYTLSVQAGQLSPANPY